MHSKRSGNNHEAMFQEATQGLDTIETIQKQDEHLGLVPVELNRV